MPKPIKLIQIPLARQATGYTCGTACIQSVLYYNGIHIRQDKLEQLLGSNNDIGTDHRRMMAFLSEKNIPNNKRADMTIDELTACLDKGDVVICFIQAWHGGDESYDYTNEWEDGHYVVAIGYDDDNIYFMDPSTLGHYTYVGKDEFLTRWHDRDAGANYVNTGIVVQSKPAYDPAEFLKMW